MDRIFGMFLAIVTFFFFVFGSARAATPNYVPLLPNPNVDQKVVADLWSRFDGGVAPNRRRAVANDVQSSPAATLQAPVVVDVVKNGDFLWARALTTDYDLPTGTLFLLRTKTPGGTLNIGGWTIGGPNQIFGSDLWNANTSFAWPAGTTEFQTIMLKPGDGNIYFSSGYVEFGGCCVGTPDPLTRADLSADGTAITFVGNYERDSVVTLNGSPATVITTYSLITGAPILTVPLGQYVGNVNFTLCTAGSCSRTRTFYVASSSSTSHP